jgi:hypothetical protein
MIRRCVLLLGSVGLFALLAASVGTMLDLPQVWVQVPVAWLLCAGPGVVTLALTLRLSQRGPLEQVMAVLGSMAVRMVSAFGGGLLLWWFVPALHEPNPRNFWLWLLLFYLFTLVVELVLLEVPGTVTPATTATNGRTE